MFTDENRAYFQEMRALAVDRSGNEHLVGLTVDETAFYLRYAETRAKGGFASSEDSDHYLALHDRHERARLAVLGAEVELRSDRPSIQ